MILLFIPLLKQDKKFAARSDIYDCICVKNNIEELELKKHVIQYDLANLILPNIESNKLKGDIAKNVLRDAVSSYKNTLETIKSRCQEIRMEAYTSQELWEMIFNSKPDIAVDEKILLSEIAQNYYQIQLLLKYGVEEFYDYVKKVYDNIYKVQSANSFKIAEKLDLKDDGQGYDLDIFFQTYKYICLAGLFDLMAYPGTEERWAEAEIVSNCINITEKYKQKLNINGINKQSLVDMWILDIRKEWLK